jgi:hypothetical protein
MMNGTATQQREQTWKGPWLLGAAFLLSCAILISRRQDAIFHAQLYAEDGHVWFADAYNFGWCPSLLRTFGGYFELLPRLGAALALLLPLAVVPLFLNLIAFACQALPVNLLLMARSSSWGSLRFRAALAGLYLALPNCDEVGRGITNAQWSLALGTFILLLAIPPKTGMGRFLDSTLMLICGLTGPFCIFLLPVSVFLAWKVRDRWRYVPVSIFFLSCFIQLWALLFLAPDSRAHRALGASPELFGRILGSQVYLATVLGSNGLAAKTSQLFVIGLICIAIGGTAWIVITTHKSPMAMKLFLFFSAGVFAAGLINPFEWDHPTIPVWQVYAGLAGLRYWFYPTLAFAWSLLYGFRSHIAPVKLISATLLCLMCFGIIRNWHQPAYSETHFSESVKRFKAAPPGTVITIPEYPQGWNMQLIKHPTNHIGG